MKYMNEKKYSSEGLDLFTMLLGGIYKQAVEVLKNLDEYVDDNEDTEKKDNFVSDTSKKEYAAPCAKVTIIDRSDENSENLLKYPRFEYYAVEDATSEDEEAYTGINDDSPIDKRMKDILDRLIFKIRTNYLGEVEYIVKIEFSKTLYAHFEWNIEHDRFEGYIEYDGGGEGGLYYNECHRKFYRSLIEPDGINNETVNEAGPKENTKVEQSESVKFNANDSNGAQIKVEEFAEKENVAEYLYRRLNADNQNKINEVLAEVEIAVNRIIDYKMYVPKMNKDGVIDTIIFSYGDIEVNFRQTLPAFAEIPEKVILDHIKNKFGFSEVFLEPAGDNVICVLK